MAIEVYVYFNGNCREAVEYYADVFGSEKPKFMTYGEMPPNPGFPIPEEMKKRILHVNLNISGSIVMFSDVSDGSSFVQGNNISLTVVSKNMDEIKTWFNKMKAGGKVDMELQQTFWSKLYGSLTDKFGIPWQFSHDGR